MKTKKIKIMVVEGSNYYNHIIENQISDILKAKVIPHLQFSIHSISGVNDLLESGKNAYQVIVFDNHFKNNKQRSDYNVVDIMNEVKSKNKDCFFISISGYREMNISAELYQDSELKYTYSKQFALKNESYEDKCSIPSLQKLMERLIGGLLHEAGENVQRIAA